MYSSTPPIHPDETLAGYLFRLAEENGYESVSWITRDIGMANCGLHPTEDNFRQLEELTGYPIARFVQASNQDNGNSSTLMGNVLDYTSVVRYLTRFCPLCIRKQPYQRQIWNLAAANCCPVHKIQLIVRCPKCDRKLIWKRASLYRCVKGHHLDEVPDKIIESNKDQVMLTRLLHEKSGLEASWDSVMPKLPSEIKALSLREFLNLLHLVLTVIDDAGCSRGKIQLRGLSQMDDDLWQAVPLLLDWPRCFRERVKDILIKNFAAGYPFLSFHHRNRLSFKLRTRSGQAAQIIRREIIEAAKISGQSLHSETDWVNDGVKRIGISVAARKINMGRKTLRSIITREGYAIYESPNGKKQFIEMKDFDELVRLTSRRRIANDQIRLRLRIHNLVVPDLIKKGVFGHEAMERRSVNPHARSCVYPDELEALTRYVDTQIAANSSIGKALSFGDLRKRYVIGTLTLGDVIKAAIDGEVRMTSGSSKRLGKVTFAEEDLLILLRRRDGVVMPRTTQNLDRKKLTT